MADIKEAIELLEKAKTLCDVCMGREGQANRMKNAIDQALTKLREPKCKTCGDTQEIEEQAESGYVITGDCPDCTAPEQPPGGEWTKNTRINFTVHFENPDWVIHKKLMEACDIIDTETQRADKAETELRKWREREYCEDCNAKTVLSTGDIGCKSKKYIKDLEAKLLEKLIREA